MFKLNISFTVSITIIKHNYKQIMVDWESGHKTIYNIILFINCVSVE